MIEYSTMENVSKEVLYETFMKTAYDILTGTIPNYRRMGISRAIFDKVKILLKEKQVELYTTEVKRNNTIARESFSEKYEYLQFMRAMKIAVSGIECL